jgi:ABC-type Mn2+/Zn2+ transport system permease subunit
LSLAVVSALQTVGIILVLSMLIIPAASAKLITNTFIDSIKVSVAFGIISSVAGLVISYHLDLPTGPSMSLVASTVFLLSYISSKSKIKNR